MSIKGYNKFQYTIEVTNDELTTVMQYTPSFSGYLKHMRVKMIKRNYSGTGRAKICIVSNGLVVGQSDWVNYADIESAPIADDYWFSYVRFDFPETALLENSVYTIALYQESYTSQEDAFTAYTLDYRFPINESSIPNDVPANVVLAAEIYLLRDYYDFD